MLNYSDHRYRHFRYNDGREAWFVTDDRREYRIPELPPCLDFSEDIPTNTEFETLFFYRHTFTIQTAAVSMYWYEYTEDITPFTNPWQRSYSIEAWRRRGSPPKERNMTAKKETLFEEFNQGLALSQISADEVILQLYDVETKLAEIRDWADEHKDASDVIEDDWNSAVESCAKRILRILKGEK